LIDLLFDCLGRPMKIELATDLSTVANLATRLSRPGQLPTGIRGTRGGMYYYLVIFFY